MEKLDKFIERMQKIGIRIELASNYPWVYFLTINDKPVIEKFQSEYGFVIGHMPIKKGKHFRFTDLKEMFKIIRKYRDI